MADFYGLDTVVSCLNTIYEENGNIKFKPQQILVEMVNKGYLGRKSGRGFYKYKN
jgi:3-hydroxybutyryl-CoA dehydrogenase